jgi:DNA-binding CsgD family transcriptional regulator
MNASVRKTGLSVLGDMPWGTHMCLFYETKIDLIEVLVPYFRAGLEAGEFCVWAVSEPLTVNEAKRAMARRVPEFERYVEDQRIEILPGREWYLSGNEFDMQRVTGGWHAKLRDAERRGLEGLRVSGNAFWFAKKYWEDFLSYEQELDKSIASKSIMVFCTYRLTASRGGDILDVARAHQFTVARRNGHWEVVEVWHEDDHTVSALRKKFESLTAREKEVMALVVAGSRNKQIAADLGVSEITVKVHRGNLMHKMEARSLAELMRLADRLGISRAISQRI